MTNTPYGNWDAQERTLTTGPAQFAAWKDMALRQDMGVDRKFDDMLHLFKRVFGPGEIKLVVDYTIR